ncbi:probable apyrase 6 isoform X2 [Capsella rubella]|uniref:probable apyrase 6 isoform X2 n=1 Tax=Capsella rubella TaxID=81985 RepID=UPI000CD527C3|nr:probable apyrase 6 isoform X2 [Capsella rubella]
MATVISIATVSGILVVCYTLLFSGGYQRDQSLRYSVVVEGGSKVSLIHVYTYEVEYNKPVSEFRAAGYYSVKLHPGLSAYADDHDGASTSLKKLVETAKGRIPKIMWKETEVRLIATSEKILLKEPVQERFLKVTRGVLESSGFMFRDEWASIISGKG